MVAGAVQHRLDLRQANITECACDGGGNVYADAMIERDRDADANGSLDERIYLMQDANYNVTAIASNAGSVMERYIYTPYGKRTVLETDWSADADTISDVANRQGFQGGFSDPVLTSQILFRNRITDVEMMRWIQPDTIGGYGDGQNLYEYVQSNPGARLDPLGLQSDVSISLSTHMEGNVRVVRSDVNFDSQTLKITGKADLRMRYAGPADSLLGQLKPSNYTNESFQTDLGVSFIDFKAGGVILKGDLSLKTNLDANYEGGFNINGNVLIKPGGLIPNARAKRFEGKVYAKIEEKSDGNGCKTVCTLSGSGSPDFFLLKLLVPRVKVDGYQEVQGSPKDLGAVGVVKLVKSTIEKMRATAYVFGFIPIKLK